jgi:hypothetical protein
MSLITPAGMSQGSSAFTGLFAHDPVDELKGVVRHMILPAAISIFIARAGLYAWTKHGGSQSNLRSPAAASVAIGMLLYAVACFVFLPVYAQRTHGIGTLSNIVASIFLAAVLVGPAIFIFGLLLLICLGIQNSNMKPFALTVTMVGASAIGLCLEYL